MTEAHNFAYEAIDNQFADESASTRRKFVGGAAATLGGMGLLGPLGGTAASAISLKKNTPEKILNVATTAEVLATIVNTVGFERLSFDAVTTKNIEAAAYEELIHYKVLRSLGGRPVSKKLWVPDAALASSTSFLQTIVQGDQIFISAYLLATTVFGQLGEGKLARFTAEFMGAEAVHRALAKQSLGQLGNDRAFMRAQFDTINDAVRNLEHNGFGFGKKGNAPGSFFDFDEVSKRTPKPAAVNTLKPN